MKTKQDLLDTMTRLRACEPAFDWVRERDGSAKEILLLLKRVDWLIWLLGRLDRKAIIAFARECSGRASAYADANDAAYYAAYDAAYYAADSAARSADSAARSANAAAAYAESAAADSAAADSERAKQLTALHELVKKVCV